MQQTGWQCQDGIHAGVVMPESLLLSSQLASMHQAGQLDTSQSTKAQAVLTGPCGELLMPCLERESLSEHPTGSILPPKAGLKGSNGIVTTPLLELHMSWY